MILNFLTLLWKLVLSQVSMIRKIIKLWILFFNGTKYFDETSFKLWILFFTGTKYFAEFRSYSVNSVFKFEFVQLIHLKNFARLPKFSTKFLNISVSFTIYDIVNLLLHLKNGILWGNYMLVIYTHTFNVRNKFMAIFVCTKVVPGSY